MQPSLKSRIAAPLVAGLIVLLGTFVALLYHGTRQRLDSELARDAVAVETYLAAELRWLSELLDAVQRTAATNADLARAFEGGDRRVLLAHAQEGFDELHLRHGLAELTFIGIDRTVFLRVHRPEQYGDTVSGQLLLRTSATGRAYAGLEIARVPGMLALRSTVPWNFEGRPVGYITAAIPVAPLLGPLRDATGMQLLFAVERARLAATTWASSGRLDGVPLLDGEESAAVVTARTARFVAPGLLAHFDAGHVTGSRHPVRLNVDGRRFEGGVVPLGTSSGTIIGELIFLRDQEPLLASELRASVTAGLVLLLVGLLVGGLVYRSVRAHFLVPLRELRRVADRAGQGELTGSPTIRRDDEMGDLARAINRMILDLRATQREHTRAIIEAALDAVVTNDEAGVITGWNAQATQMFGWTAEQALGRRFGEMLLPPEFRAAQEQDFRRFVETGESELLNRRVTTTLLRRNEQSFPAEIAVTPIRSAEGWVFSAFVRDVTEQRKLEEQLLRSQKMEAVGRLAGGVAHDFNNIITAILGYSELAERAVADAEVRQDLAEIRHAATRAAALTRQLLAFARRQVTEPRVLEANALLRDLERLLRRLIGEDIQLETRLEREPWSVEIDPAQLEQVLVNMAVNARDAMPAGGRLVIETANIHREGDTWLGEEVMEGDWFVIAVSDTGTGMTPDIASRIFDPFFTTKEVGKGTGLGLATSYGIVEQAGGHLRVYTEPGRGTTFRIYLPRARSEAGADAADTAELPLPRGSETVLLVEDEEQVRVLAQRSLRDAGYIVLSAADGQDAVRIAKAHVGCIDLLVTDVVMPRLGGIEAAQQILAEREGLRVLYLSGYSEALMAGQGLAADFAFLAKPFSSGQLIRTVRRLLDLTSAAA